MNLREQEYVCAVARHKSITKAARELNMTQAALSLFLQNLEKRLGVVLFERYKKEMIPTYAGEIYLDSARKILEEGERFDVRMREYFDKEEGRIRFGINSKRSPLVVPELLVRMRELYPNVEITVKESDTLQLMEMLQNDELDCVYSYERAEGKVFHSELLAYDRIGLVMSRDNPMLRYADYDSGRQGYYLNLRYLKEETFLLYENDETSAEFYRMAKEAGFMPKVQEYYNVETMLELAERGYGILYMNELYVYHFRPKQEDSLRFLLTDSINDKIDVYLSYHQRLLEQSYGREFLTLIKKYQQ